MSNYSAPPYGGNYHDQNPSPYPPQSYPNTYPQTENGHGDHGQGNTASNYDAYGYNGAISGFNPAAVPSVAPIPIFQGWNQDSVPLPPYTAPPNVPSYPGYQSIPHSASQYYPAFNQTGYQQSLPPPQRAAFNQRELSEGEFEEGAIATNTPPAGHSVGQYNGNERASYGNNARRSVYSQPQGYNTRQSPAPVTNHNSPVVEDVPDRRGSDSYSPCISPREMNNAQPKTNGFERQTSVGQNGVSVVEPVNMENGSVPNGTTSHAGVNTMANGNMLKAVESFILNGNSQQPPVNLNGANGRTTAQARKRAQDAVLDIWPHVPYQTYIAEGFMENYVNGLFDAANIPRDSGKVSHGRFSPRNQRALPHNFNSNQHKSPPLSNGSIGVSRNRSNGNEVKPLSVSTSIPAPVQSQSGMGSATTPVLPQTPTTLNEKERKLQAKMEALRKSREERAQKAAAQKTSKVPSTQTQAQPAAPSITAQEEKPHVSQEVEALATTSPNSPIELEMEMKASPPHLQISPPPSSQRHAPETLTQPVSVNKPHPADPQPLPPPSIPGLFLASTAPIPPPTNPQNNMYSALQGNARKRPVAADFDGATPPAPAKRPFGHSRVDESLVIDVSEDDESDDEDVAMDLDSNQDSPVQAPRRLSDHRVSAVQNLPPISNFPRPGFNSSSSPAAKTPPIPPATSRPPPMRPAELQRKESEIEELKRRIAQAEARSKARQTPSGTRTPVSNQTTAQDLASATSATAPAVKRVDVPESQSHVSAHAESLIRQISTPQQSVIPNVPQPASEQTTIPDLPVVPAQQPEEPIDTKSSDEEEDEELLRQEELARNEVAFQANEVAQKQKKLEQMKAEIAAMEQAAQEAATKLQKAKERDLRLREEKELRLQRQKQVAAENLKAAIALPLPPIIPTLENRDVTRSPSVEKANLPMRPTSSHSTGSSRLSVNGHSQAIDRPLSPVAAEQLPSPVANGMSDEVVSVQGDTVELAVPAEALDNNMANANALEAALQEAVRAEADSHSLDEGEVDMDMEMSHAPDPTELAPVTPEADENSPAYSPLQQRDSHVVPVEEEEEEEDDYEPPEATPPADSPPFSPAPPIENDLPVFDEMMQDVVPSISDNSGRPLIDEEDDQSALPVLNGSAPVPEVPQEAESIRYFTPYVSPLRRFRAYRFHPQFKAEVAGGLRSLTYSHEIDPNAELCRYELAGGICNDNTCYCLHFKDIGYKDSLILAALGSPNQFKGPRFAAFRQGLTDVLNELRVKKIRDFDVIASEILAYRAKFLGDESKILPLEGVTI